MGRRAVIIAGAAAGLVLAAFLAGFAAFVATLEAPGEATPAALRLAASDVAVGQRGIVALTGGGGARIARAVELQEAGVAGRVLVSGIHPQVTKADLGAFGTAATFACCVDLGPYARTTKGNALEARSWLRSRDYEVAYLVTSNFHLPRARWELRRLAPEITVIGVPVDSNAVPAGDWTWRPGAWWALGKEYAKLLIVRARGVIQPG